MQQELQVKQAVAPLEKLELAEQVEFESVPAGLAVTEEEHGVEAQV